MNNKYQTHVQYGKEKKVLIKHSHIYLMYRPRKKQVVSESWASRVYKRFYWNGQQRWRESNPVQKEIKKVRDKINSHIFAKRPLASSYTSLEQHRIRSDVCSDPELLSEARFKYRRNIVLNFRETEENELLSVCQWKRFIDFTKKKIIIKQSIFVLYIYPGMESILLYTPALLNSPFWLVSNFKMDPN